MMQFKAKNKIGRMKILSIIFIRNKDIVKRFTTISYGGHTFLIYGTDKIWLPSAVWYQRYIKLLIELKWIIDLIYTETEVY